MVHHTKTLTAVLVDKNADRRTALRECLKNLPFKLEASSAVGIADAVERCHHTPDLDFMMVAAEGSSAYGTMAEKITEELKESTPPLIAVLGAFSQDAETLVEITQKGYEAAITSPFSVQNVQRAIEQVISSKKYGQFQEARGEQALQILMRYALATIDRRAELLIDHRDLPPEDFRSWKKTKMKLESLSTQVTPEHMAELLEKLSADAKPFADRTPHKLVRRQRKVLHPARVVRKLLEQRGISDEKFISAINVSADFVKSFLEERVQVDPVIAAELARVLGHTTEYWLSFLPPDPNKPEAAE